MTGEEMRRLRRRAGLRQEELGALIGYAGGTISQFENGKHQISKAVALATKAVCSTASIATESAGDRLLAMIASAVADELERRDRA